MISVPGGIKRLYEADHAYKNIRIHFPNGERSDICNDLIVKNSVSFKESLCSQNTLKFGLCESPVFECEVVGVGNIKGATIEVSVEVECPSTYTGAEWRADLQKYVYSIPYGTFRVDSCKRQADMNHRKIVAYDDLVIKLYKYNQNAIGRAGFPNATEMFFTQNISAFITETMQGNVFKCLQNEVTLQDGEARWAYGSTGYTYKVRYKQYKITEARSHDLYYVKVNRSGFNYRKCVEYARVSTGRMPAPAADNFTDCSANPYKYLGAWNDHPGTSWASANPFGQFIYPEMSLDAATANTFFTSQQGVYIRIAYEFEEIPRPTPESEEETGDESVITTFCDPSEIHLYTLTLPDTYSYGWTRELAVESNKYAVLHPEQIDLRDLLSDYIETMGMFCRVGRDGTYSILDIQRQFGLTPGSSLKPGTGVYPQAVTGGRFYPDEYQSCWYDDDYTIPFGAAVCKFKTYDAETPDQIYTYEMTLYFSGYNETTDTNTYKVYTLQNNKLIDNVVWTKAQMQSILERIGQKIYNVMYMPVEFKGNGLPYVEIGDTFEVLTKSNDSITTIVLNRTLKGEMTLTDEYKSV